MGRIHDNDYLIRVPLKMVQLTDRDGNAFPLQFDWENPDGEKTVVTIDKVVNCMPLAEQQSGAVGDRYECIIDGRTEYLFYSLLKPRKWFRLLSVDEAEYNGYYRLPGESRTK